MIDASVGKSYRTAYESQGYLSPVRLLSCERARARRARFEAAERHFGELHYLSKVHTLFSDAAELATNPDVLDVVETLIGPDILLFDVTYIVKEPHSSAYVSWHQDLAYWGFSGAQQVSMWLALSPATEHSGCMRMVPGSHRSGQLHHQDAQDASNVLHRGQTVPDVAETTAVMCPLDSGEASFHHGWTLHASMPNRSDDRRIGLNVQYIAPTMRQLVNAHETACLVRGRDGHRNFAQDRLAVTDFEPQAVARHAQLERARKATWDRAAEQR